jgi:hypothetical protein
VVLMPVFENRVLRRVFGFRVEERRLQNIE